MEKTIYAPATPEGMGGIAIIRISGPAAREVLDRVFKPVNDMRPRMLCFGQLMDGESYIDEAMAVYMPAPHTYTREDVCELHIHGSQAVLALALKALAKCDCEIARPGEFTRRAFENGRLDLAQAEAVMDIISAQSESAAAISSSQLTGTLSRQIYGITELLIDAIASLEAALDYPEDEWEQEATQQGVDGLEAAGRQVGKLLRTYASGTMIKKGMKCAIIGRPNAGKSTFLNAAAGFERAIVDNMPGTTRDTVEHIVEIEGNKIILIDTAGIREDARGVEKRGIELGMQRLSEADVCLLIIDAAESDVDLVYFKELIGEKPCIAILNKADRPDAGDIDGLDFADKVMRCSAINNEGVHDILQQALCMAGINGEDDFLLSNARQYEALSRSKELLDKTMQAMESGMYADIALIDAKQALDTLGEITGESAGEDVIDAIFSKFCLGK